MTVLSQQQFNELKDFLAEQQRDLITLSHQNRDKETSGLHREILDKINKIEDFIERSNPMLKAYEDQKNFEKALDEKGQKLVKLSVILASLGGVGGTIIYLLKKFL